MWGTLIFKKNGVSKAQFFLASQGRRLEAGAAKAPRGRRGQGFTVWYSVGYLQTNNFSTVLFGHSASGHGQKVWVI